MNHSEACVQNFIKTEGPCICDKIAEFDAMLQRFQGERIQSRGILPRFLIPKKDVDALKDVLGLEKS